MSILSTRNDNFNDFDCRTAITEYLSASGSTSIKKLAQAVAVDWQDPEYRAALRRLKAEGRVEITAKGFRMVKQLESLPF